MSHSDTIAAVATPPGEGAIAMVRISGPNALAIANRIFEPFTAKSKIVPRRATYGRIQENGETLDQVLLTTFHAPSSFTGEDMAEISCHGGVLLSARTLELALRAGARAAEPGEFSQRAFYNGKIDLTQAEAIMDIISARTPLALRAAAHAAGKTVALPRVDAAGVTLRVVAADTPLVLSAHGVREPAEDRPTLPPDQPELIVIPGLGFDRRGGRLGHGGGHYDRLLARLPATCLRVGLAYDQQVLEVVPTESHDLALHALVTPAGWVDCGN